MQPSRRFLRPDPLGLPRNPFQVYLMGLAIVGGLPLLFGVPTAGSIDAELPRPYVFAWGLTLVCGASAVLIGMFWPGHPLSGLLVKRTGLVAVGAAAVVYTSVIVSYVGVRGCMAALVVAFFAVACFWQVHRINQHVKSVERELGDDC